MPKFDKFPNKAFFLMYVLIHVRVFEIKNAAAGCSPESMYVILQQARGWLTSDPLSIFIM